MTIPEGYDRAQIEWNIYAFGCDVRKFTRKRDAARLDQTRARWQKKVDEYTVYLEHNKQWLAELNLTDSIVRNQQAIQAVMDAEKAKL